MSYNWNQQSNPNQGHNENSTGNQETVTSDVSNVEKPHVTLPSLSSLKNGSSVSPEQKSASVATSVPSVPSVASVAHTVVLTHEQMSTASIMNPTGSATSYNDNVASDTTAAPQDTTGNNATIQKNHNNNNNSLKRERQHSGFSVASFDNPLPPTDKISQPGTAASSVSPPAGNADATIVTNAEQQQDQDTQYRPLNVKDALSYLEQVKFQFNSRPDIYNQFLDIMKDFKSQSIDTPGVIERVSGLFKGYPTLIQGFNTFLPQGYRIDCSDNPDDPIRVTTPMGSTTLHHVTSAKVESIEPDFQQQQQIDLEQNVQQEPSLPQQRAPPPISQYSQTNQLHQQQQQQKPNILNTPPPIAESQNKKPADVEFSQAISYVNKIKNRFADQPDIYKNFLEILQTYQREQKPINEVYAQVTVLFKNAPDLLDDFKKFLPDSSASDQQQQPQQSQIPHLQQQNSGYMYGSMNAYYQPARAPGGIQVSQQNLPPIGSFSPPNNGVPFHEEQQIPQVLGLPSMLQHEQTIDITHPQQQQPNGVPPTISNENIQISNLRSGMMEHYPPGDMVPLHQRQHLQQNMGQEDQFGEVPVRPEIDLDPSVVPVVPEPTEPIENNLTLVEETSFFDRVKKFIGNKQIYTEFLKILNLFSQDLLDVNELVEKVDFYIGSNKELFDWFKNFVGYRDQPKIIENIVHEKHRLDLDLCEACGPSYKKLPKSDTFMPCSGRDDMCWEVLNDEWVGHPVWASEDSGFIAHRKNQYEETLFKAEEERHEYDFYIESNLRTIQTLETIANKISNMSEDEKQVFKLPPGLGHTSLTIYKKVIRKVYDKERGFEVIDALHEHPAIAVPVILKRLKQKDEEWRRAQREWNKVWRELEQKVYFKSLDHLGLTFKQADKKLLTTKQLISEISSIKVDQTNKRIHWLTPKPKSQLDFDITDFEIIFDILKLSFVFVDCVSNYSNPDKERLKDFLRVFIALFFSIPIQNIDDALKKRGLSLENESEDGTKQNSDLEDSKKRKRSADIHFTLNDILHRTKYQKLKHSNKDEQQDENDDQLVEDVELELEAESIRQDARKPWLLGDIVEKANTDGVISQRMRFNFFGNTNIYIFIRHLITLHSRLLEVKTMNEVVTKEINNRKTVQFAKDLCLISTQLKDMGLDFVGKDSYQEILRLGEDLILGDIEHQWFEESLRQAYNNKAFKLYTIDKVIQAIIKHAHTLMTDNKSSEIVKLFERDRTSSRTSTKDQILYRLQVRSHMSNTENMFRIQFDESTKHVCIQYIALDDLTLKDSTTEDAKWKYYITSYSLPHPTEGIDHNNLSVPFLERILEFEQNEYENEDVEGGESNRDRYAPEGVSSSILKINITPVTYALDIDEGSIDIFSRKSINKYPVKNVSSNFEKKKALANKFLDGKHGWKKSLNNGTISKSLDVASDKVETQVTSNESKSSIAPNVKTEESIPSSNTSLVGPTGVPSNEIESNEKENGHESGLPIYEGKDSKDIPEAGPIIGNSNV